MPHRCTKCDARRTPAKRWTLYQRPPKCRSCGHTRLYLDRWMLRRGTVQRCNCTGYWFPHRKGSKFCEQNPEYAKHMEARYDERSERTARQAA